MIASHVLYTLGARPLLGLACRISWTSRFKKTRRPLTWVDRQGAVEEDEQAEAEREKEKDGRVVKQSEGLVRKGGKRCLYLCLCMCLTGWIYQNHQGQLDEGEQILSTVVRVLVLVTERPSAIPGGQIQRW
jgi:hypothetical protein